MALPGIQQRESQPPKLHPPNPSITFSVLVWGQEADSFTASISLIADFLTYLFQNKQLTQGTVAGYQTAIAFAFKHMVLTVLLASFSREHPRRPRVLSQWDLSLVLIALTRAPFKPLQLAPPKFLAWKVFFLTLLASMARRGELPVITARGVQHDDKWKSVSLFPCPSFISKTQLCVKGAEYLQKLVIPALLPRLGLDWTTPFVWSKLPRSTWPKLRTSATTMSFSSSPTKMATKETFHTLSGWIRKLIHHVYQTVEDEVLP